MDRLNKLRGHLSPESRSNTTTTTTTLEGNECRSFVDYAKDAYNMITQPVVMTETHGGMLAAKVIVEHCRWIFTLSGGHISPILASSQELGVRIIDVRAEENAVFAADSVNRLVGAATNENKTRGACVAVTAGPGLTNCITPLQNCLMAQSPLVILGGAAATLMQGRGALQDIDQMAIMEPVCKATYSCRSARDIVPMLRDAFKTANSGVPGPVFVELPLDVLYPGMELLPQGGTHERLRARDLQGPGNEETLSRVTIPVEYKHMSAKEYVDSKPGDSPIFVELPPEKKAPFAMQAAMSVLQARLHAGVHTTEYDFSPLPVTYPKPQNSDLSKAIKLLSGAKNPLFVLGSQAMLHGENGAKKLAQALNTIGAPCFLGGMSRGLLGRNSAIHIRQNRGKAMKKSDLIVLIGVIPDFRLDYGRSLPSKTPIISVNRSLDDLYKNSGIFWSPTLAAHSDPAEFVLALASSLPQNPLKYSDWAASLKAGDQVKEDANKEMAKLKALGRNRHDGEELVNPLHLLFELEETLDENSVLVADGGDFVATASYITRPNPLSWLDPGAYGTLGVGGGFALGAALVHPDRQIWIIYGDGSVGYTLLEFDTYVRHGLSNIIALVGNDACWTQIEREQVPMFQSSVACVLDYVNYDKAAEALGAGGVSISSPNDNVKEKLSEALQMSREGKPVLINAKIGKTAFREGSLSV